MKLNPLCRRLAAQVIEGANRQHPADAVLRKTLSASASVSGEEAATISQVVFSYYRWLGWLNRKQPLVQQLEHALRLAEAFEHAPQSFSDDALIQKAVPAWIRHEMEITPAWVRTLQEPPKLWLRAKRGKAALVSRRLGHCKSRGTEELIDCIEYVGREDLFRTEAFHAGEFEIQDVSSQAIGHVCSPRAGETWWDACAGEGGKLLHLSELMENKGLIWASDRADWRLQRLKRRAARAKAFNYRAVPWSGGLKLPTKTTFDGVLVDAPCSGIGTWQRNPHARWTTTQKDVEELSQVQRQLLKATAAAVKPGGKLIYAVCSLARSETQKAADEFEREFPYFSPLSFRNPLAPQEQEGARIYLWPQEIGGNGMFIAAWKRQ